MSGHCEHNRDRPQEGARGAQRTHKGGVQRGPGSIGKTRPERTGPNGPPIASDVLNLLEGKGADLTPLAKG